MTGSNDDLSRRDSLGSDLKGKKAVVEGHDRSISHVHSRSRSNSTVVTPATISLFSGAGPAMAGEASSSSENKDLAISPNEKIDPESGLPAIQEQTADEILAQTVETLPLRQLLPAFLG